MARKSSLEELVHKTSIPSRNKDTAKEEKPVNAQKDVKLATPVKEVKKEPEKKQSSSSQSVQDQAWKKVGSLLRTAARPRGESVDDKAEQRKPLGQFQGNLEESLPQPQQAKPPTAADEKTAYLPSQSSDKGPYAVQEKEANPYLPANTERHIDETSFQKFEREVRLASHLASDRIAEQEKVATEKVYDSLKAKDSKETQKYKRLERF